MGSSVRVPVPVICGSVDIVDAIDPHPIAGVAAMSPSAHVPALGARRDRISRRAGGHVCAASWPAAPLEGRLAGLCSGFGALSLGNAWRFARPVASGNAERERERERR